MSCLVEDINSCVFYYYYICDGNDVVFVVHGDDVRSTTLKVQGQARCCLGVAIRIE